MATIQGIDRKEDTVFVPTKTYAKTASRDQKTTELLDPVPGFGGSPSTTFTVRGDCLPSNTNRHRNEQHQKDWNGGKFETTQNAISCETVQSRPSGRSTSPLQNHDSTTTGHGPDTNSSTTSG